MSQTGHGVGYGAGWISESVLIERMSIKPSGGIGQRPNFLVETENHLNGIVLYVELTDDHAIHTETTLL